MEINTTPKWQTRDEMDKPTNPLQLLVEMLTTTSRDIGQDKLLSAIYGIVCGWDDASYDELSKAHNWNQATVDYQKQMHVAYNQAWNLYLAHLTSK